jgi:membrane protein
VSAPLETVARARRADVTFVAAAVAYYWLGSLVPLLVLGFVVLQVAYGNVLANWSVAHLDAALTPTGRSFLRRVLLDSSGALGLGAVGAAGLVWGWSRLYRALEAAFARVYETTHTDGFLARALAGAVVVPAVCIGMLLVISGLLTGYGGVLWELLHVIAVALALFPVFVTLPPTRPGLRSAVVGATATAVSWVGLRLLLEAYVMLDSLPPTYDLLGALVLVVAFLYLGTLALLLAVALAATLDA